MSTQLIGGSQPIGSIIQAAYNLVDPNWLRCTGAPIARATYPNLAPCLPNVGTFAPTIRTPASSLANFTPGGLASNGASTLVIGGTTGTSAIQLSTNGGATWATETTPASFQPGVIVWTGTNFAAMNQAVGEPIYSPTGVTWTSATGAAAAMNSACSDGAGKVLAIDTSDNVYLSSNNGQTYATITTQGVSVGSAPTPMLWSGTQFMIFNTSTAGLVLQVSTTGASGTWTTIPLLPWGSTTINSACSDGAGNVLVILGGANGTDVTPMRGLSYVSKDGGATWLPTVVPTVAENCSYANGRWFVSLGLQGDSVPNNAAALAVSPDLEAWVYVPGLIQPGSTSGVCYVAYADSLYCAVTKVGISTLVENTANMYLPYPQAALSFGGSSNVSGLVQGYYQNWIKFQ